MTAENKLLAEIERLKKEIEANTFSKDGNNLRRNKDKLDQCKKDIALFKELILEHKDCEDLHEMPDETHKEEYWKYSCLGVMFKQLEEAEKL